MLKMILYIYIYIYIHIYDCTCIDIHIILFTADAKAVDNMSYAEDDSGERLVSTEWEDSLYTYLDSQVLLSECICMWV
jgi:hypothetical protein